MFVSTKSPLDCICSELEFISITLLDSLIINIIITNFYFNIYSYYSYTISYFVLLQINRLFSVPRTLNAYEYGTHNSNCKNCNVFFIWSDSIHNDYFYIFISACLVVCFVFFLDLRERKVYMKVCVNLIQMLKQMKLYI